MVEVSPVLLHSSHLLLTPVPSITCNATGRQPPPLSDIRPLLQSLVPQQPPPPAPSMPPASVLLLIKQDQQQQQPQQVQLVRTVEDVGVEPCPAPLDLSVKKAPAASTVFTESKHDVVLPLPQPMQVAPLQPPPPQQQQEPFAIYRTNSCSSTSSTASSHFSSSGSCSGGSGGEILEERRLKRKEQNKAAALSYRQRKKSFSEQIETEHERLTKKNVLLRAQKTKLEDQIQRMRTLLSDVAAAEDKKKEEDAAAAAAAAAAEVQAPVAIIMGGAPSHALIEDDAMSEPAGNQVEDQVLDDDIVALLPPGVQLQQQQPAHHLLPAPNPHNQAELVRRTRKYTWPLTLTGKDRKKEQNKLASRRFRQRRKQEQSVCEVEAQQLEDTNRKMRERCDELESKIKLLKDLVQRSNTMQSGSFPQ